MLQTRVRTVTSQPTEASSAGCCDFGTIVDRDNFVAHSPCFGIALARPNAFHSAAVRLLTADVFARSIPF